MKTSGEPRLSRYGFDQVYERYAEQLYRFVYYKTYHRETAEDLTSQTFLKALEKYSTFDPEKGTAAAWLYQIARNLVVDHFRKKSSTTKNLDVWDLAGTDNVELDLENKEQLRELQSSLSTLPTHQREILILRIWENLPYREISAILNKSEASCKMLFSRTLAQLRECLSTVLLLGLFFNKPSIKG